LRFTNFSGHSIGTISQLDANRDRSECVWLVLAKKGMTDPTSLTYAPGRSRVQRKPSTPIATMPPMITA